jgi:hypothetical protein
LLNANRTKSPHFWESNPISPITLIPPISLNSAYFSKKVADKQRITKTYYLIPTGNCLRIHGGWVILGQVKINMEAFLIGLLVLLIGLAFTFLGYQFFRILIPIWGFFAGFSWGAGLLATAFGQGFLATALSWGFGLVVGLAMGFLAYWFYEAAVGILAGFLAYWLLGGFLTSIGFNPGVFVTLLATAAGVVVGFVALYYKAPKALLIVLSAFGGATAAIGGLLIAFGQLPIQILGTGLMSSIVQYSFGWSLVWLALAAFGALTQYQLTRSYNTEAMNNSYMAYSSEVTRPSKSTKTKTSTSKAKNETEKAVEGEVAEEKVTEEDDDLNLY